MKMNIYYSNICKHEHGRNMIRLWCNIVLTLVEICDFATNEFATSCDYLTFTTTIGYIYNYCLHLKPLATTL